MQQALFNWSGGKDSALALYTILQQKKVDVQYLLTSVNKQYNRVSMHGVRTELLQQQAQHIGIPLHLLLLPEMPSMEIYEQEVKATLRFFEEKNIRLSVFGDIFLEDLRAYRESQLAKANWKAEFPLWKIPTSKVMQEFLDLGFKAIVVCVNNQYLDQSFVGRIIDRSFIQDLPDTVDICGENGEYHSFVYDGPIFQKPVSFSLGETIYRTYPGLKTDTDAQPPVTGFWFMDLLPTDDV
ncbi:diphthine--ammonia ligase [Rhodocytophaga aerolata]|uniref:Diphthine--ammonia ligase n=1 Tax=Rhodocytophaga aerolata TaxID=455078 RepID=A0ABT8RIX2_9BACT|nr:diphthine--ammonia ligase [Rhodocytophaga aerolata]MDO1450627.1 diphthine--ammonia ligase [Rhodocytophaga aerolata]